MGAGGGLYPRPGGKASPAGVGGGGGARINEWHGPGSLFRISGMADGQARTAAIDYIESR